MKGTTTQLTATVSPEGTPVIWESDATDYVRVDNNGLVTAIDHNYENPRGFPDAIITASITIDGVVYSDYCWISVDYPE